MSMRHRLDARLPALLAAALAASSCGGGASTPTLVFVAASPAGATVPAGLTRQYAADGYYSDGSVVRFTEGLDWQTGGDELASVDASGLVTTHAVGGVSISVTHLASGLRGVVQLTVTAPVLQSVEVSLAALTIPRYAKRLVSAVGRGSDGTTVALGAPVTWSSSDEAVASVDQEGVVTGLAGGTTTISARLESLGLEGFAELSVSAAAMERLALTPAMVSLPAGAVTPLEVSGFWSDGTSGPVAGDLQWSTLDGAVASVDGGGRLRAVGQGATQAAARHLATGLEATAPVTVTPAELVALELTPSEATVAVGAYESPFRVVGRYSDGYGLLLCPPPLVQAPPAPPELTWASSSPRVATVSGCGFPGLGGIEATSTGSAMITASLPALGVTASSLLTVVPDRLVRVVVTPDAAQLPVGASKLLGASGRMLSGGTIVFVIQRVSWTSSAPSVASVSTTGNVSAIAPGTAIITATETTGLSGSAVISVTP